MSSWHSVFSFVISTISLLGAMVGLIVASTISQHNPHSLHGGLEWPQRLMSDNAALPTRYTSDGDIGPFLDSPKALPRRHLNANLFVLGWQRPAAPQMPARHSSGEQQGHYRQTTQCVSHLTRKLTTAYRGQSRGLNSPHYHHDLPRPAMPMGEVAVLTARSEHHGQNCDYFTRWLTSAPHLLVSPDHTDRSTLLDTCTHR